MAANLTSSSLLDNLTIIYRSVHIKKILVRNFLQSHVTSLLSSPNIYGLGLPLQYLSSYDGEYFIHSFIHSSVALQPFVGPWPLLQFRNLVYTVGRTPWTSDQPVTRPPSTHRINAHSQPCPEWDLNPRPVFERMKTFHTLDCATAVIGLENILYKDYIRNRAKPRYNGPGYDGQSLEGSLVLK
jgi:hypothetical protein